MNGAFTAAALAATALSAATIAAMFAEDEFDVVHMDSSDDEDASPVPRVTDDEFDPPVRMDSSDDEQEAYYIDNID